MFDADKLSFQYKNNIARYYGPEVLVTTDDAEIERACNEGVNFNDFGRRLRARYAIARRLIGEPRRGQLAIYYFASALAGINTAVATANFLPYAELPFRIAIGLLLGIAFPVVLHEIYWWGWRRG